MDTVILAAGRNERLNGLVPAGHKPLIIHSKLPLIAHAARQGIAALQEDGDRVIVVASPENAAVLHQVLDPRIHMIVQRLPNGPGDALLTGLRLCGADEALILMGDNVTPDVDVEKVRDTFGNVVGVSLTPIEGCERFTRWRSDGTWVEKVPVKPALDMWTMRDDEPHALVWLGPLKLRVLDVRRALLQYRDHDVATVPGGELPIGPTFNSLPNVQRVPVTSVDLGVEEALP